jgi:hypothetical protein
MLDMKFLRRWQYGLLRNIFPRHEERRINQAGKQQKQAENTALL